MLHTGPARPPPPSILAANGVDDAPEGNEWLLFDVGGALLPLGCTLRYTCSSHRNSTFVLNLEQDLLSPLTRQEDCHFRGERPELSRGHGTSKT